MVQAISSCQFDSVKKKRGSYTLSQNNYSQNIELFPRKLTSVLRYQNGVLHSDSCNIICEQEFHIFVNGKPLVNLLCSDAALRELAYGFLFSEQVISSLDDVLHFVLDKEKKKASFELDSPAKNPECPTISSGFGGKVLCSCDPLLKRRAVVSAEDKRVHGDFPSKSKSSFVLTDVLLAMDTMNARAKEYAVTRGMHCSALFKEDTLIASYEDIGRHNTFDKLVGYCVLNQQETKGALLTTTGRVSGEMMRKAQRLGVAGVSSFSGPTDTAIQLAQDANTLLLGYVGGSSATVYAGTL